MQDKDFSSKLEDYTKNTYNMSLDDALKNHLLFNEKGNELDLFSHNEKSKKPIIAIDGNKTKILYLNKNGDFEEKEKKKEVSFSDREALKWYKLVVAAIYGIFHFIKKMVSSFVSFVSPSSLRNSCSKALRNNFTYNKHKERLEEEMQLRTNLDKNIDKSSQKDSLNEDLTKDSNEKKLEELNKINKEQLEREQELLDIKRNLKSVEKKTDSEQELLDIKDRLNKVDMSIVEEKIRLARIKGYENDKTYNKLKKANSSITDQFDDLDLIIYKGIKDSKNYFNKAKAEKNGDNRKNDSVKINNDNPNRKPIEVEELKPVINPIDKIFDNLDKDLEIGLKK